jgi:ribose-phosphate pyrophosphokinase
VSALDPHPAPGTSLEVEYGKRLMLFSGRANPELAYRIADKLNVTLGGVECKTFADGEVYCRYQESIRGADVFIVQPTCGNPATGMSPNDSLMELLLMIDAAVGASAHRVIAVMPWFGYSRQDKKSSPREPISARVVARALEAVGADRVLTMDLHAGQIQGFFEVPVDHMTALPMLAQYFRDLGLKEELVAVAPDTGRTRLASKFAEMIGGELAVLQKDRPAHNVARITNIIGDVAGRCAVMTDDMVDTAGTLVAGAKFLKDHGAEKVFACATHGIFSPPAIERIEESVLDSVVVTDTVPVDPLTKPERVTVLTVADILAETIHNVFADDSVSAIFGDMNALF